MSDQLPPAERPRPPGVVLGLLALVALGSLGMFVWQIFPFASSIPSTQPHN